MELEVLTRVSQMELRRSEVLQMEAEGKAPAQQKMWKIKLGIFCSVFFLLLSATTGAVLTVLYIKHAKREQEVYDSQGELLLIYRQPFFNCKFCSN